MRKSLIIVLAGLLLAAVVVVGLVRTNPPQPMPVYQGKTAEQWLGEVFTTNQAAALQAFRAMGTNALPAVVNGFRRRDYPWTKFYLGVYPKLPARLAGFLPRPVPVESIWSASKQVLLMRSNPRLAFPDLVQLLRDKDNPAREYIMVAAVGPFNSGTKDYVPVLVPFLQDANPIIITLALRALGHIGPGAKEAIPTLTTMLTNPDRDIRGGAAWTLWEIDHQTNMASHVLRETMNSGHSLSAVYLHEIDPTDVSLIPKFIEMLYGSDQVMRLSSASILGSYGQAATAAIPELTKAIQSGDAELRVSALHSLKRIDPNAAAKYQGLP